MKGYARLVTGLFAIIMLLSAWAYHIMETRNLTKSLNTEAATIIRAHTMSEGVPCGTQVSLEASAGRTLPLFGAVWGKITVFTRGNGASGKPVYGAIEYFYVLEEGQWRMTESGGCTGPECRVRAEKAFGEDGAGN
ncbi:MAG TPA: hypothetical protein PLJ71_18335 [Candidatus Hydrogenedentes bacterium]|nr:hypothetical protein [Candidatus Hydrogenedentota bacterium]HQM50652.1 hypothetical protein [Candidatus Hydrogenedentota bacterium]